MLLFLSLVLLCAPVNAEPRQEGTLTVEISGIETQAGGVLRVALFRGESGWPKLNNAIKLQQLPASSEQLSLRFDKLPHADNYAIEIHHDENGNNKFDMRWLPYPRPKEGVGVSNNRFGFGHPDFADARFSFNEPAMTIHIQMRY